MAGPASTRLANLKDRSAGPVHSSGWLCRDPGRYDDVWRRTRHDARPNTRTLQNLNEPVHVHSPLPILSEDEESPSVFAQRVHVQDEVVLVDHLWNDSLPWNERIRQLIPGLETCDRERG